MIHLFLVIVIVSIVVKLELMKVIIVIYVNMDIISYILKKDNVLEKELNQITHI